MKNIVITGTKGKTTITSIIEYLLRVHSNKKTIMVNSMGLYTNGYVYKNNEYFMKKYKLSPNVSAYKEITSSDVSEYDYLIGEGSYSLSNTIEETTLAGNIDIGIITNVYKDHIDGRVIKNQDNLLNAKLFVARNSKPDGVLILNISNSSNNIVYKALRSQDIEGKQVILVSTSNYPEYNGMIDYYLDNNSIFYRGKRIADIKDYPLCYEGKHSAMLENILTLIAVCDVLKIGRKELKEIRDLNKITPGRLNIFSFGKKVVFLDFAHEEESIKSSVTFLRSLYPDKKLTGVVRLSYYRDTAYITELSRIIARLFDKVIIYDKAITNTELQSIYLNKLGKYLGEVGELMFGVIYHLNKNTEYIPDEYIAIESAIMDMEDSETIFIIGGDNLEKSALFIENTLKK